MEIPQANGWTRWLLTTLVVCGVMPIAGWTLKTTVQSQEEIDALIRQQASIEKQMGRIERKLDRLLGSKEGQ